MVEVCDATAIPVGRIVIATEFESEFELSCDSTL